MDIWEAGIGWVEWGILNAVSIAVNWSVACLKIELGAIIHLANVKIFLDFFGFGRNDVVGDTPDIVSLRVALLMWIS